MTPLAPLAAFAAAISVAACGEAPPTDREIAAVYVAETNAVYARDVEIARVAGGTPEAIERAAGPRPELTAFLLERCRRVTLSRNQEPRFGFECAFWMEFNHQGRVRKIAVLARGADGWKKAW